MFKTQLSSNLVAEKILIAIIWIVTILVWRSVPGYFSPFLLLILVFLFVLYSVYIVYIAAVNVAYDASNLFISDRKTEKIIPLSNITHIKRSISFSSPRTRWKITYLGNDRIEEDLYFYAEDIVVMNAFIKAVRMQNPIAQFD